MIFIFLAILVNNITIKSFKLSKKHQDTNYLYLSYVFIFTFAIWGPISHLITIQNQNFNKAVLGATIQPKLVNENIVDPNSDTTITFTAKQYKNLRQLINTNSEAANLYKDKLSQANSYLNNTPNPVRYIQLEGNLDSSPQYKQSVESLKDVPKVYTLAFVYGVTRDQKYLNKTVQYLDAWSGTYKASGNPINETGLQELFESFDIIKNSIAIEKSSQYKSWMKSIALGELNRGFRNTENKSNWNSHRVKIILSIAYALNDKDLITKSLEEYKLQIANNLNPDGTSYDLISRDAIYYHRYTLEALLVGARSAKLNGVDLYNFQAVNGASLKKSSDYLIPYVTGEKKHKEWVNSSVKFDRMRSNAGQSEFKTGTYFNPMRGLYATELICLFDNSKLPIIQSLLNSKKNYPSFRVFLESVQSN